VPELILYLSEHVSHMVGIWPCTAKI